MTELGRRKSGGGRGRAVGRRRYSRHAAELMKFFAEHRVSVARQVHRAFEPVLPTDRTTRLHLATLVRAGDLEVVSAGLGQPNIYRVTSRGLRRVADVDEPRLLRQRSSESHLRHELEITEFATLIRAAARAHGDLAVRWDSRASLRRERETFSALIPDYAFVFEHSTGKLVCLVEVSCGEESPTRLGQKLRKYAAWAASPESAAYLVRLYERLGAKSGRPTFRLLIVAENRRTGNDETRLRQVLRECSLLDAAMASRIWLTTIGRLREVGGVDGTVWTRVRDVVTTLAEWDHVDACRRRQGIVTAMGTLPRHRLFPTAKAD